MKIKILVCCHKKDIMATQEPYMPIHVGKDLHPELDLGIIGDNTGDNISKKNGSYCELTGMYWAWKNLKDIDAIGICHYRRYFDLSSTKSINRESFIRNKDIPKANISTIDKLLEIYDVILPGYLYLHDSVWDAYAIEHSLSDIKVVEETINELTPEYSKAFNYVMKERNYYSCCNMLICKKETFDSYCKWLFSLLESVDTKIDISNYDLYQKRIFGFLSERLLNVYHLKIKI